MTMLRIFIFISILSLWIVIYFPAQGQKLTVGLLIPETSKNSDSEIEAAFSFLKKNPGIETEKILTGIITDWNDLKRFQVLWLHCNDSVDLPKDKHLLTILKQYLEWGGKLILTQEAFVLINQLELEPNPVETRIKQVKDDGYGRQLGLHAFRSHPVFAGLNGGAYIFKPMHDTTVRIHGYFDDRTPLNGAVIAVDWDYIFLRENSKLMLEYWTGKGRVLAIGAYIALSQPNKNRQHLEFFLTNCLDYLTNSEADVPVHYWQYYPQTVYRYEQDYTDSIERYSDIWRQEKPSLNLKRDESGDEYWEVAGERMLIMGKESGGIEEIWTHPFMSLRDYHAGIKFPSADSIRWLNNVNPSVEICPEALIRDYQLNSNHVKETVFVSPKKPVGIIHYEYSGSEPADFFIKFKSNMRLMWPYSEKVFQSLEYSHQPFLKAIVISEGSGDFTSLVGTNKEPQFVLAGQYEDYNITWTGSDYVETYCEITGIASEKFEAGGIFYFRLVPGDQFDIVFTAEATEDHSSAKKAIAHYMETINHTSKVFNDVQKYYSDFLSQSLMIETPDPDFNVGYKWALVATDRFFVRTPGLGASLVAGFNTTNTGWDGEHTIDGRPGYAWYFGRDGQWSGFALLDYGDFEKVKAILEMYIKFQDLNGKIYHEVSTSGIVHYDAADATPLFIILAGKYLKHSGDIAFIKSNWQAIKKAIDFCFSTDTDSDHLIENTNVGHGWVEGGNLFGTHSTLYLTSCWAAALDESDYMASTLELTTEAGNYLEEMMKVKELINNDFWNEQNNYFFEGKFIDGTFMDAQSIMPSIPLYFNQVPKEKADLILPVFAGNNFSSDWGCRIIGEDSPNFNPRGYHTGSVWPLFSGWVALAEYNNGNEVQGFTHIMNSLIVYRHWGLGYIEEVLNGETYQPSGVCHHQCWSETMVLQPAIEGMLGLKTNAMDASLELSPRFPADWDSVSVSNIRLGEHNVGFKMNRKGNMITYHFSHTGPSYIKLNFQPSMMPGMEIVKIESSGKVDLGNLPENRTPVIILEDEISVTYHTKNGISVLPVVPSPKPGDKSTGLKIISDRLEENIYVVDVEALQGTTHTLEVFIQDWKAVKVDNAKVISNFGNRLKLEVDFSSSDKKYIAKEIKIKLEE
jgi:glycogen debranching enzyme